MNSMANRATMGNELSFGFKINDGLIGDIGAIFFFSILLKIQKNEHTLFLGFR
jgi:hypothetical protein